MPNPAKSLIFCVHSHQPVGNFGWVFLEAYEKSYKPFFETLDKHPSIPVCCHFSGSLLDWLEKNKPEFLDLLRKMSKRGQLEFIGGGYYEPIYGAIPKRDLTGQIGMMREKLKALFGKYPQGAWLTERVWDPDLVEPLKKALVEYTILDDLHLEKAGIKGSVTGYYQAKEGGRTLNVFASMKTLRYLMPFRKAEETLDFIRSYKGGPGDALVFADDCEKFGMWPGTYHWVYEEKWLDKLFSLLEKDKSIEVCTFSNFRKRFKSKGFVKIPHASYSEMMEWSGGHFYNFFKKYPESRYMRDRMWSVSDRLHMAGHKNGSASLVKKAKEALFRAQCNCTYWHGVFGGLYLHHLRSAVFENLIQAEDAIEKNGSDAHAKSAFIRKLVLDSGERWQIRQKKISAFFNPGYGAALEELDYFPKAVNLMCNLQRHKEAYHEVVLKKASAGVGSGQPASADKPASIHDMLGSKEENLEKYLHYDPVRRLSFMDHFFEEELSLDEFSRSVYAESGDFVGTAFKVSEKKAADFPSLSFERKGRLNGKKVSGTLLVVKNVIPRGDSAIRVQYLLKNLSSAALEFVFGVEFNFSIGENHAMKGISQQKVKEWIFNDAWRGIALKLTAGEETSLLACPVETVSESESGLERTYQELAVLSQRRVHIKPKETKEHILELGVSS